MEVERVQDGPLKNSEIARFLEASKTSYKALGGILSEKKEPSFQQRTLLEIASETQNRDKTANSQVNNDISEIVASEEESEAEIKAKEIENQRIRDEEESIRLAEAKKKEEERINLESKEKENYDKGFIDGKAALDAEHKSALEAALIALENARKSMLDLNASHFIKLREQIAEQILNLSSERAGTEIKELPEKFFAKIESLLETVGEATKSPVVYLNNDDLDSIRTIIKERIDSLEVTFEPDSDLICGDIIIKIDSILIKDTTKNRSNAYKEQKDVKPNENMPTESNKNDIG